MTYESPSYADLQLKRIGNFYWYSDLAHSKSLNLLLSQENQENLITIFYSSTV